MRIIHGLIIAAALALLPASGWAASRHDCTRRADCPAVHPRKPEKPWRVVLGFGLGIGGHDGSFIVQHGTLQLNSGLGSAGDTLFAQVWRDGWLGRDWSTGLEYIHFRNLGGMDINLPKGFAILSDPVTGTLRTVVASDAVFANIAYRPPLTGWLQPYVGVGLGVGAGSGDFYFHIQNAFIGSSTTNSKGSATFPALKGMMGMDIPLTSSTFVGLQGQAMWITAHPVGINQRYLDFIFSLSMGARF